ncbi:sentrin-specific protease 2 isoform X2 [Scleropages formosus]|uniref:sentrin-specific protease 2 isoform X2 n=1 Tax=Scleropages formosus TaxID=113540 RepID=UPI00087851BA|nr:sentrin-specific protease 2 isoform X2 [Scleropages formosus]
MYEWIVDGISSLFAPHAELKSPACSKGARGPQLSRAAGPDARRQEETPSRPAKRNYQSVHSPDLKPDHREVKRPRKDVVVSFVKKTFSGVVGLLRLQSPFTTPPESQSACTRDQVPAEELLGVDEIQGNGLNKWITYVEMKMEKPREVRYNGKVGALVRKPKTGMFVERTKGKDHRRSLQFLPHRSTLNDTTPCSVDSPAVPPSNWSQKPCLTVEAALKETDRERYRLLVEMVSEKYSKNKPLPFAQTRPPIIKPLLSEMHRPAFFSRTHDVIAGKAGPLRANASASVWRGASSAELCKNGKENEKVGPRSAKETKNHDQGAVCVQAEDTLARHQERSSNTEFLLSAAKSHETTAWKQPVDVDLSAEVAARLNLVDCAPVTPTCPAIKTQQPVQESYSSSDEFPRLTQEMQQEVRQALVQKDPNLVLSSAFKLRITQRDLTTLKDGGWLNDEVINFYMNLLMCRNEQGRGRKVYAFNTFFFPKLHGGGHAAVRRWTKAVDLFQYEIIVVPLHMGVHWSLSVIDFREKSVMYYDSMGQKHDDICKLLLLYLKEELKIKNGKDLDISKWVTASFSAKEIPQQNNGSDCGVFVCKYADYISQGRPLTFTQSHVPYFRRRMIWEILNQRLL